MKKIFLTLFVFSVFFACQKENTLPSEQSDRKTVSLYSQKPEEVKTFIDASGTSFWQITDAIGVISGSGSNLSNDKFVNDAATATERTSFSGETSVGGDLYAYYPWTNTSVSESDEGILCTIASLQHPEASSFDGASDVMVARPFRLNIDGSQVEDLSFKRLGAILKLSLMNYPTEMAGTLSNERILSVTLGYEQPLAGDILVDYRQGQIIRLGDQVFDKVSASYGSGVMGSRFDCFLVTVPQVLEQGRQLSVEVQTENYIIRKKITLQESIGLTQGKGNVIKCDLSTAVINPRVYIYFWAWTEPANAQEMTLSDDGVYEWCGDCVEGEFKFLTSRNEYWSGWFRDENASDYWTLRKGGDQCMFKLSDCGHKAGEWHIRINTNDNSVHVAPKHLYLDFWAWGTAPNAKELTETGFGTFTWTGYIPVWDFKLLTINKHDDDYWSGYFRDPDAAYYWTLKPGNQEKMFKLEDRGWRDGTYTIEVNTQTLQMRVIPHIWLIGAFDWGWNRAQAQEMAYESDGIVSWTGMTFANATFKFLIADQQSDGDAPESGYGTYIRWYGYVRDTGSDDYWTIVWNDASDDQFDIANKGYGSGIHTITLNLTTKKVDVTPVQQ